jgi:hypothetical protein
VNDDGSAEDVGGSGGQAENNAEEDRVHGVERMIAASRERPGCGWVARMKIQRLKPLIHLSPDARMKPCPSTALYVTF